MKIGIDARLINETGVGRYIRNLLSELAIIDSRNTYVVFVRREQDFSPQNSRWTKRIVDVPWHSITEQIVMPFVLLRERLDLLHVPYFNVPLFYPGKFVVTIHDLIILHFDTGKASTRGYLFYKIRRLGYLLALNVAMIRAKKIIAVSRATKQEILDHFRVPEERVVVTYEG
jgi:hypothetical protein